MAFSFSSSPDAPAANRLYRCSICGGSAAYRVHRAYQRIGELCQRCCERSYPIEDDIPADVTVTMIQYRQRFGIGRITPDDAIATTQARIRRREFRDYPEKLKAARAAHLEAEANAAKLAVTQMRATVGPAEASRRIQEQADELFAA